MTMTNPALNGWSDSGSRRPPASSQIAMQTFYDLTSNLLSICAETATGVFTWVPLQIGGGGSSSNAGPLANRPTPTLALVGTFYCATDQQTLFVCSQTAVGDTPVFSWVLLSANAAAPWATQTDWAVNASTGSDSAAGTASQPLATLAQFRQRLNAVGGPAQNLGIVTLAIVGNTNTNDPLDESGISPLGGTQVNVVGTPVPILSNQVITAVTPKNAASGTNVPCSITVAGLPVSWTASGILNVLCVITSAGPRLGSTFVAVKDLGGKAARISDMEKDATGVFPFAQFGSAFATPQVNDTFTAYTLPVVDSVIVDAAQQAPLNSDGATTRWLHRQIRFAAQSVALNNGGCNVAFQGCSLPAPYSQNESYYTCFFRTAFYAFAGFDILLVGGATLAGSFVEVFGGCSVEIENFIVQGPISPGFFNVGGLIELGGDLGIFDGVSIGYKGQPLSALDAQGTGERVYGSGNGTFGMALQGGVFTAVTANRVVTGSSGDLQVGNVTKAWTTTPYYDRTIGSGAFDPSVSGRVQGTFTLNGATPVVVAAAGIQASDIPIITRTSLGGTPGEYAWTATVLNTSFSVTGTAGDTSTCAFELTKG